MQHCLGVAYLDGRLYVADTYNHKIKVVNAETGQTRTLAGTGKPGRDDTLGEFYEPAGITVARGTLFIADTNNHLIRTVDPTSGKVATFTIEGLSAPTVAK